MAFKLVVLAAVVAMVSGVEHAAVSHQSISFHTEHAAPAHTYHAVAAPVYHAAPIAIKAAPIYHAAPVYHTVVKAAPIYKHIIQEEHHAPAHYSFEYGVHDEHTGDIKEQKETREGDKVQGYYTLKEADGTRRIVHYTADKHSGFNAVVTHEGKAVHAAPVLKAAPVILKAAPVYHTAPVYHAAPVIYKAAPIAYQHAAQSHVSYAAPKASYHY